MARIAWFGLGAMGARMAANLVAAGHDVVVWNRDAAKATPLTAKGARLARSPREAAEGVDFALSMVRDDDASRRVWLDAETGALAGLPAGAVAVECSTLSLTWTRALAQAAAETGVPFLDAPLAGSRPQAEAKALIFFAGGAPEDVDRVRPVLGSLGAAVHYAGPSGAGMAVKLSVNTFLTVQAGLMAEVIAGVRRAGVDPARAVEILAATPVCSAAAKVVGEMMLRGAFAPLFPIALAEKDLGYALAELGGADGGEAAPITTAARAVYRRAIDAGHGDDHISAILKLYGV